MNAPRNPYFTTCSGREIDLVNPSPADICFEDLAHHLSHLTRYGGACAISYTVAQHLVLGADLCTAQAKPYWLVHDAHEAFGGDDTTPKKRAFPLVIHEMLGGDKVQPSEITFFKSLVRKAFDEFEQRCMKAVHEAAGLAWPVPAEIDAEVKRIDRVMLLSEWKAIMPGEPPAQYRFLDGEEIRPKEPRDLPISEWNREQARNFVYRAFVDQLPVYAHRRMEER